jgi:hypothetical protein
LPARPIAAAVLRTGRRYAGRILVVSIAVSLVITAVDIAVDHVLSHAGLAPALAGALGSSGVSLLGAVFLAGFLSRLVSTEHGAAQARLGQVLRSLPWAALIAADLLTALIVVLGLVLLIIPGLIALNLLAVVGPVIEIEDRRAWAGLRRSAQLVRPHFWKVALIGTLPVLVASGLESALPNPEGLAGILTALVARSIVEGVLEALVGLLLVELCYRLLAAELALRLRGRFGGASFPRRAFARSSLLSPVGAAPPLARASRPRPPVPVLESPESESPGQAGGAAQC